MKSIVLTLVFSTAFLLVGCNTDKKKNVSAPKTMQQIQSEKGIPYNSQD
jgi:uncharacterized protein YcfL